MRQASEQMNLYRADATLKVPLQMTTEIRVGGQPDAAYGGQGADNGGAIPLPYANCKWATRKEQANDRRPKRALDPS